MAKYETPPTCDLKNCAFINAILAPLLTQKIEELGMEVKVCSDCTKAYFMYQTHEIPVPLSRSKHTPFPHSSGWKCPACRPEGPRPAGGAPQKETLPDSWAQFSEI